METLKRASEFEAVYKRGNKFSDRKIKILAINTDSEKESRVAFVVSKKFGNAVKRNRIKRLLRESWRTAVKPTCGYDFILLPRAATIDNKPAEIADSIDKLLEKI